MIYFNVKYKKKLQVVAKFREMSLRVPFFRGEAILNVKKQIASTRLLWVSQ